MKCRFKQKACHKYGIKTVKKTHLNIRSVKRNQKVFFIILNRCHKMNIESREIAALQEQIEQQNNFLDTLKKELENFKNKNLWQRITTVIRFIDFLITEIRQFKEAKNQH